MRDDLRENLSLDMQQINRAASDAAMHTDSKYGVFKKWLLDNGAVFDDAIEFPAVFGGGLEGLAAKKPIGRHEAYIFIPNTLIVSIARIKADPELRQLITDNFDIFGDIHPDREQMLLATFLLFHHLKGEASFWHPYINVMNISDIVSDWSDHEIS